MELDLVLLVPAWRVPARPTPPARGFSTPVVTRGFQVRLQWRQGVVVDSNNGTRIQQAHTGFAHADHKKRIRTAGYTVRLFTLRYCSCANKSSKTFAGHTKARGKCSKHSIKSAHEPERCRNRGTRMQFYFVLEKIACFAFVVDHMSRALKSLGALQELVMGGNACFVHSKSKYCYTCTDCHSK